MAPAQPVASMFMQAPIDKQGARVVGGCPGVRHLLQAPLPRGGFLWPPPSPGRWLRHRDTAMPLPGMASHSSYRLEKLTSQPFMRLRHSLPMVTILWVEAILFLNSAAQRRPHSQENRLVTNELYCVLTVCQSLVSARGVSKSMSPQGNPTNRCTIISCSLQLGRTGHPLQ